MAMILQFVIKSCLSADQIPGINFCVTVNDKMQVARPQTAVHLCRHIIMLIQTGFHEPSHFLSSPGPLDPQSRELCILTVFKMKSSHPSRI